MPTTLDLPYWNSVAQKETKSTVTGLGTRRSETQLARSIEVK
jgi:hypothetical protein